MNQKSDRWQDGCWDGCWMALGSIFGGFWDHLGRQVGTKLAPKSKKWEYQEEVKKWVVKNSRRSPRGKIVRGGVPLRVLRIPTLGVQGDKFWTPFRPLAPQGRMADIYIYIYIYRCLRQTATHPCGRTHLLRSKILEKVSPRTLKSTKLGPKIH